MDLSS